MRIKGVVNVPNLKLLLLLLLLVILPTSHAVDVITGSGYTSGTGEGYYTEYSFINFCPLCGHYDCLEVGVKRYDEITCLRCDADYSFSGKEKHIPARGWLTPYEPEPIPEPTVAENATVQPVVLSPLEQAKQIFLNNKIIQGV